MLVPGFLGWNNVVFVSLLVVLLVIRHKIRNATVRKEEIARLLKIVSHEAAVVEAQTVVENGYFPKYYSGNCQIIHWRQGHKDECHPPTDFAAKEESEIQSNNCEVESTFKTSSNSSSVVVEEDDDDNGNLKRHADAKATHSAFALSSSSTLAGVSPAGTSSESSLDVSSSRTLLSGPNDKLERQCSDDIAAVIPRSRASVKKMEKAISPSSESNLTHCVNNLSKLNRKKSTRNDEEDEFRRQFAKDSNLRSGDVRPKKVVYKKSTRAVSSELLVTDSSKKCNLISSSSSRPKTITSDREDDLQLCENKHFTTSTCSTSGEHSSSAAEGHSAHSFNFGLSAKSNAAPTLPQTTSNSLKTSMLMVVQQFKASKQSKSYLFGFCHNVDGKHNYKIIFPYELFMELYSYDAVELCPFGLYNCGNRSKKGEVLHL